MCIISDQYQVNGWIRNLNDGRVEAILEDYEINVSRVIERCYTGSPEANVDNIKLEYESYMEKFNNFTVSY